MADAAVVGSARNGEMSPLRSSGWSVELEVWDLAAAENLLPSALFEYSANLRDEIRDLVPRAGARRNRWWNGSRGASKTVQQDSAVPDALSPRDYLPCLARLRLRGSNGTRLLPRRRRVFVGLFQPPCTGGEQSIVWSVRSARRPVPRGRDLCVRPRSTRDSPIVRQRGRDSPAR